MTDDELIAMYNANLALGQACALRTVYDAGAGDGLDILTEDTTECELVVESAIL